MLPIKRFKPLSLVLTGVLVLFMSIPAQAQSAFSVRSVGIQKCSNFSADLQKKNNQAAQLIYSQWLAGYLTGKNSSAGVLDLFPIREPLDEWIRLIAVVCLSNKDKRLVEVTEATLRSLTNFTAKKNDKNVQITHSEGKKKIVVYASFLRKTQSFLRKSGYRVSVDGKWGDKTEAAFRRYKKNNKLAGPPIPDSYFLLSMISKK